ncbi:NADH-quinone oxidoreductase subunit N [Paenibacillus flagellatus]|uniref:NADH-quinone oxidoreductase subunit N n=1 Tax=Paenibacillus flagellatus TaxID=2211139 RepID=A0A2V5KQX2_9BACL|nr:NADH-quinone oxidoreductase subunit N [Paenibacillus flagellatus]PYI51146.1 NADH-quinone oxidoreductase subunit N [Paenibacillus flagellatus]
MDQLQRLTAGDIWHLAPELTLVVSAVLLSLIDLLMPRSANRTVLGWLAIAGVAVAAAFVVGDIQSLKPGAGGQPVEPITLLGGSWRIDDYGNLFKLLFLGGTALVLFMSIGNIKEDDIPHRGEFYYLFLPATIGAMVLASSADLITLFVGLELLSITSYVLVGMRKKRYASNEGAFKYVVTGAISSAIILYGMSFLYGMSGSTNLAKINEALSNGYSSFEPLIYVSFFLLLAGFGFKVAAAPFHMWAPDVYQGAPTPVTAYLAVVSKAAGFAIAFRVLYNVFGLRGLRETTFHGDFLTALLVLAAAAMVVGNFVALRQRNMKRLLAYSGVANAGYLLVPIGTEFGLVHFSNFSEMFFYLIAYLFMNIGAIAVYAIVSDSSGNENVSAFAGLYYRSPATAVGMVVLLLSLAGLPVTGGFFGKLYIMLGTLQMHHYWLAAVMIGTSIVSFYYYFGVIRQMFMRSGSEEAALPASVTGRITMWICVAGTLLTGFFPHVVLRYIESIFSVPYDMFIQ